MVQAKTDHRLFPIKAFACLALVLLALALAPNAVARAGGVSDKLSYIRTVYPTGSHFTTTGQACNNSQCSKCSLNNIPARGQLSSGATAASTMGNAWSCTGFAKYVFYNVFGVRHTNANNSVYYSLSDAKVGDYVQMWNTSAYGYNNDYITHCAIFMGWSGSTPLWYESNYSVCNQVYYSAYNQKRALYRIYHAYNYDTINGMSIDSQPPVFDKDSLAISNLTWQGYDISIKVSDNVGVTRVSFPTWTPDTAVNGNNQDDIVWHAGTKGADGATWSTHVYTSQHNNETGCRYWTDIYAYDAAGNETVFSKAFSAYPRADVPIQDTTAPTISSFSYEQCTYEGFSLRCKVTDNVGVTSVTFKVTAGSTTKSVAATLQDGWATAAIATSSYGNQYGINYSITATAKDKAGNTRTATLTVPVPARDTEKPTVTNIQVLSPTPEGYTLLCDVTDNDKLDRAELRTYTVANGSDDAVTKTITAYYSSSIYSIHIKPTYSEGYLEGGELAYRIPSHNRESGLYVTEITVYDVEGNYTRVNAYADLPPYPAAPVVTSCQTLGDGTDLYETTITFQDDQSVNYIKASLTKTSGDSFYVKCSPQRTSDGLLRLSWLLPAGDYKLSAAAFSPYSKWYDPTSATSHLIGANNDLSTEGDPYYFTVAAGAATDSGTRLSSIESDGKLLALYQTTGTWSAAKRAAAQLGGSLAILDSAVRQDSAASLMRSAGFNAWIGSYVKLEYYGSTSINPYFAWVDDSRVSYANWNPESNKTSSAIEYFAQIDPYGGWNAVINSASGVGGYIAQFDPVNMEATLNTREFSTDAEFDPDALTVYVTFADGTRLESHGFDVEFTAEPGAQTLTVTYGNLSQSFDITVYKPMDTPDMALPVALRTIDDEAFAGMPVSVVKCPNTLERIGQRAFAGCGSLRQIYLPRNVVSIASNAFEGCTDLCIWGIPGTMAEYFAKGNGYTFYEYRE